MLESVNFLLN